MFILEAINNDLLIWEVKNEISEYILDIANIKNSNAETLIIVACEQKKFAWVDFLLSLGANPKDLNLSKQNTIQLLIDQETPITAITTLISLGVDPNHQDQLGQSALYYVLKHQRPDLTQLLLSEGANPNLADLNGNTPLFLTALTGDVDNLKILLESDIEMNSLNSSGQSALHMAVISGSIETVNILIQAGVHVNHIDTLGRTALHYAAMTDESDQIIKILGHAGIDPNKKDNTGMTALAIAATQGLANPTEALIKIGASLDGLDQNNESILIKALKQQPVAWTQIVKGEGQESESKTVVKGQGSESESKTVVKGNKSIEENSIIKIKGMTEDLSFINEVIKIRGSAIDKNFSDNIFVGSSTEIINDKYTKVASLLLNAGSSINFEKDIKGNIELMTKIKNNEEMMKLLVQHEKKKASGKLNTSDAKVPIHISKKENSVEAQKNKDEVTVNIKNIESVKGLPLNAKDPNSVPYLIIFSSTGQHQLVEQLLKQGHDSSLKNKLGLTALMVASALGHIETINVILKYDKNVNYRNAKGESALSLAIMNNKADAASALLKAGANPDVRFKGAYLLHIVAENGASEIAKAMLNYGANPRVKDIKGRTPAQYAGAKGFKELEGILGGPKENE